jgi:hypothetical protein
VRPLPLQSARASEQQSTSRLEPAADWPVVREGSTLGPQRLTACLALCNSEMRHGAKLSLSSTPTWLKSHTTACRSSAFTASGAESQLRLIHDASEVVSLTPAAAHTGGGGHELPAIATEVVHHLDAGRSASLDDVNSWKSNVDLALPPVPDLGVLVARHAIRLPDPGLAICRRGVPTASTGTGTSDASRQNRGGERNGRRRRAARRGSAGTRRSLAVPWPRSQTMERSSLR